MKKVKVTKVPDGLEILASNNIRVKTGYRSPVEFDDVLPGDLIVYRGNESEYHFVKNRTRNLISGWYFTDEGRLKSGGWGETYKTWNDGDIKADRVAPALVEFILNHYKETSGLDVLHSGDCKVD